MQTKLHNLLVGAACALLPVSAFAQIDFLTGVSLPNSGGEILSFYSAGSDKIIASTFSSNAVGNVGHGVRLTQLNSNGTLSNYTVPTIDLANTFSTTGVYSVSSVQVDNQGRDFGVATVIPGNDTNLARVDTVGKAVFFQISTGSILGSLDLGYHPDSVTMTPNGQKLLVANEAEYVSSAATVNSVSITQRAGSISVIDLSSVTSASDLATKLGNSSINTTSVGFGGLDLSGIRINATSPSSVAAGDRALYVEPEYITTSNTQAFVSLQENNAIATIDLTNNSVSVRSLGTLTQTIDNTDRKSGQSGLNRAEIAVNASATGLLMPDTITKFEKGGETYIVTANEGDGRNDALQAANDEARVSGGRLTVVAAGFEGAGNMFGTRSISIVRASDGAIVWDSSDGQGTDAAFKSFEDYIATNDSATFGMDANSAFNFRPSSSGVVNNYTDGMFTESGTAANSDTRSDNKGPEPESVAYASINGRDYVFTAMERQGGIFMFDVTDLSNVAFVDYLNLTQQASSVGQFYLSPESLQFLSAEQNGTGKNLLLVGFENPTNTFGGLAVLEVSAIPEPSTAAALAGFGALGLAALRRRRSSR